MKLKRTRCDECGKEHAETSYTYELRKVSSIVCPQMERNDANSPGENTDYYTFIYDFCDYRCLSEWLKHQSIPLKQS